MNAHSSKEDIKSSDSADLHVPDKSQDKWSDSGDSWLVSLPSALAIFGDSPAAVAASFALFGMALLFSLYVNHPASSKPIAKQNLTLKPHPHQSKQNNTLLRLGDVFEFTSDKPLADQLTNDILEQYSRDGVFACRGLLEPELTQQLIRQSVSHPALNQPIKRGTQFFAAHNNALYDAVQNQSQLGSLVDAAFHPKLAHAASFLLNITNVNLRIVRDLLIAKDNHPATASSSCGWHVDDTGFWPTTPESLGINAWIALDDYSELTAGIPASGGVALAIGSHRAAWRTEAYQATGAPPVQFPPGGYANLVEMVSENRNGTCHLHENAPKLVEEMERIGRVYPLRAGDIVFMERWMFHRTVNPAVMASDDRHIRIYKRYSLRYAPGDAIIIPGSSTELSVMWDKNNAGRTLDEITGEDGPWYPQVWPNKEKEELEGLSQLLQSKLPAAQERQKATFDAMKPLLKKVARERHRQKQAKRSKI